MVKVIRICKHCGRGFYKTLGYLKLHPAIFCSNECRLQFLEEKWKIDNPHKGGIIRKCIVCEEEFKVRPADLRKTSCRFCSLDCWYLYNRGSHHPLWTGGQHERVNPQYWEWRKQILKRDFYRCQICGVIENLEVHHIYAFNEESDLRWDIGNGITLCRSCHRKPAHSLMLVSDNLFQIIEQRW